jgi:lipopolysaccharide transport system ATP-binding protein
MSEIVIRTEDLGKKYIIGHQRNGRYKTFREQILQHAYNFYSRTQKLVTGQEILEGDNVEEFWALKDVSFEIKQGDRLGIIGRNGAGKSTLLKILSRITEPTKGRVMIKGRVASLLEVGTGFHQELTGRENIFLNGAILGMSRTEIKRKFDEIVEFSGVEKFLDTPVKRYSSGMYVRLAFAIAAHLEPEILIVDEVLAVGDAEFQEKCIGKMDEVGKSGRTILFVSHQMGLIAQLCNKAILLENGKIKFSGKVDEAIVSYNTREKHSLVYKKENATNDIYFQELKLLNDAGEIVSHFKHDEAINIYMNASCKIQSPGVKFGFALLNNYQQTIFTSSVPLSKAKRQGDNYELTIRLQSGLIIPNSYMFYFYLFTHNQAVYDSVSGHFPIKIFDNGSEFASFEGGDFGTFFMKYTIEN